MATADLGIFTPSTNFDLYFGSRPSGGGIFYQDIIDEIEIFDRALSQAEIRAILKAGREGKIKELLNPSNGHHYQAISVPGGINWTDAKAAAESLSLAGVQGQLATIPSQQENDFIIVNFPSAIKQFGYWLGGFQPPGSPEPGGNWQWVTGEPFGFANWVPSQPNNVGGAEAKLHFHTAAGLWNDLPGNDTRPDGYIVEYEPAP